MSAKGHLRTKIGPPNYASALGGKADVRELPAVCLLIARSGHSGFLFWHHGLCARDPIRNIQIMCLASGTGPKTAGSHIVHLSVS